MQHFATAVSCGVEDIRKQPLQHLSAQNDLGVNRNNNCGRRREYGAAASGLCSLMSRVLPLAGPITCWNWVRGRERVIRKVPALNID